MNNNRGNNRRRGRGSNNRQQGGGQQVNRIDSRARGNAPQMLEKYRKLAHDAHLNGDRVTEEYNLQFADHYFRVLADQRQRQEEQRQPRTDRWQDGESEREDSDAGSEYGAESEYSSNPYNYGERPQREDRPRYEGRDEPATPEPRAERTETEPSDDTPVSAFEPPENPFVRDSRGPRGLKPRRPRRDAGAPGDSEAGQETGREARGRAPGNDEVTPAGLNLAALPPAISPRDDSAGVATETDEAKPKPKRRAPRRAKPTPDDGGEPLQATN